ncbi:MAG: single-stranded DNA-binding protein [Deltaproteobacteria bacterium]|nr:single-stranded DNA-binding protein [Deltaproteobacteria bacterium]
MARGVNKAILLGNVGKDPEVRYTQNGTGVANFTLATTERRKGPDGQWTDHTEWHNVVAWGKTAETCSQWVKKGTQLYIEGRIQTRKWQDKEGNTRYSTEIVIGQMLLVGRSGGGGARPEGAGAYGAPAGKPGGGDDFPGGPDFDEGGFDPNDDVPF